MHKLGTKPVWKDRYKKIERKFTRIELPETDEQLTQDTEWCKVVINGKSKKIRFHDYDEVYEIQGLYEELFYNNLECRSPSYVVDLLQSVIMEAGEDITDQRVLDVGAGNGMVGDELSSRGVKKMIGIDLIPEAKDATLRDRPGVYDEYFIADLTDFPDEYEMKIKDARLNCMTVVAALGFGDIPVPAFLKSLELVETPAWMAFNINENFIKDDETTGFNRLIKALARDEYILIHSYRRYRHRLSVTGKPLYYVVIVARKIKDIPDSLFKEWETV